MAAGYGLQLPFGLRPNLNDEQQKQFAKWLEQKKKSSETQAISAGGDAAEENRERWLSELCRGGGPPSCLPFKWGSDIRSLLDILATRQIHGKKEIWSVITDPTQAWKEYVREVPVMFTPFLHTNDQDDEAIEALSNGEVGREDSRVEYSRPWTSTERDNIKNRKWKEWYRHWQVTVPLYAPSSPSASLDQIVRDWALLLAALPAVSGCSVTVVDGQVDWREADADFDAGSPIPIQGLRPLNVPDLSKVFEHDAVQQLLNLLHDPAISESCIVQSLRFLALSLMSNQEESRLLLGIASIEALCKLDPDEQISKGILDCVSLLFRPSERSNQRIKLKSWYDHRCSIVHGKDGKKTQSNRNQKISVEECVRFAGECIARRIRLAVRHEQTIEQSLSEILQDYLNGHGTVVRSLRDVCDAGLHEANLEVIR